MQSDNLLPWFLLAERPEDIYLGQTFLCLDFETDTTNHGSALHEPNDVVLACWQVVSPTGEVIKTARTWGGIYQQAELLDDIKQVAFVVAQNAKFEAQWLKRCGAELRDILFYDTMLAEWVLHGNRQGKGFSKALGSMARRYGVPGKKDIVASLIEMGVSTRDINPSWLLEYCHADVEATKNVFLKQRELVAKRNQFHLVHTRNLTCAVLADIEFEGLNLDPARVDEEYRKVAKDLQVLGSELAEMTGGINLGSPKQLAVYLYDVLKFKEPVDYKGEVVKTGKGARSTNSKVLADLVLETEEQKKFFDLYKRYNKAASLLEKNLDYFKLTCEQRDGRFFGQFKQGVVQTHRLASSGIPVVFEGRKQAKSVQLQNIPREYKRLFCAGEDDYEVAEFDGCFTAGHKILMEDMTWKNVEDVVAGDRLVGIEEEITRTKEKYRGRDRKMLPSVVEAARARQAECLTLTLSDNTRVTVSKEHPFMVKDSHSAAWRWETAEWIKNSRARVSIRKLIDVWEDSNPRAWGKLSAYIDGEGHWQADKMQLAQQEGSDVLADMEAVLQELKLPYKKSHYRMSKLSTKPVCSLTVTHLQNLAKIQQLARPVKATRNPKLLWENKTPKGLSVDVVSVEAAGIQTVYSIQTSTKTYVAEGLFSHNCQLEFRVAVDMGKDTVGLAEIENGVDIHSFTAKVLTDNKDPEMLSLPADRRRQEAKKSTFRPLYGGGSGSPALVKYCEYFKDKYKGISGTQRNWALRCASKGEYTTPYGMVFYFPGTKMQRSGYITNSTNIYNYPVQGFATGEIIPLVLVYFWHRTRNMDVRIFATIHDSIACKIKGGTFDEVMDVAKQAFTYDVYNHLLRVYGYKFRVPLGLGAKVSSHWGDTKDEVKIDCWPDGREEKR